jgi:hypothetical protein
VRSHVPRGRIAARRRQHSQSVTDASRPALDVEGSIGSSGLTHVTERGSAEVGDGLASVYDGSCSSR